MGREGGRRGSPWAGRPREGAANLLECALERYSSDALTEWQLPVVLMLSLLLGGSLLNQMSGLMTVWWMIKFLAPLLLERVVLPSRLWANWRWGLLDEDVGEDAVVSACRGFRSVPGPLQSVQRAEFWGVILALQASDGGTIRAEIITEMRGADFFKYYFLGPCLCVAWCPRGVCFCVWC